MIELYLVRHGESELNRRREVIGGQSSWCELNALGIEQSKVLGQAIASRGEMFSRVFSSTAVRAQQTARYCLEEAGMLLRRIETDKALLEQTQGVWEGVSRQQIYTPERIAQVEADPWNFCAPSGGESQGMTCARFESWVERVLGPLEGELEEPVLIFSHGMVIRSVLAKWIDRDTANVLHVKVENTSITRLRWGRESGWEVIVRNDVRHLRQAGLGSIEGSVRPQSVDPPDVDVSR